LATTNDCGIVRASMNASSFTISRASDTAGAVYAFAWRYWVNAEEASAVA